MRDLEQQIIDLLGQIKAKNRVKFDGRLFCSPEEFNEHVQIQKIVTGLKSSFDEMTLEFLEHPYLQEYFSSNETDKIMCNSYSDGDVQPKLLDFLKFWLLVKKLLVAVDRKEDLPPTALAQIEKIYEDEMIEYMRCSQKGIGIHNFELFNPKLIMSIYLSNNSILIQMIQKYIKMIPTEELFVGHTIPPCIRAHTDSVIATVVKISRYPFFQSVKPDEVLAQIECNTIKLQREYRQQKRKREQALRVKCAGFSPSIEATVNATNQPYLPQGCSSNLAERIMLSASKVNLFPELRHLTHEDAVGRILDDGLSGRATLIEQLRSFTPYALGEHDIRLGDANVVCFGPQKIHPIGIHPKTLEFIFDGALLKEPRIAGICKQQDFGYVTQDDSIKLFSKPTDDDSLDSLYFSHTGVFFAAGFVQFILTDKNGYRSTSSQLPPFALITDDLVNASKILTLNFFKFIDQLYDKPMIQKIYARIERFTTEELDEFLCEIGRSSTQTSEFNIFGTYQINFSLLKSITARYLFKHDPERALAANLSDCYVLNIKALIDSLQSGDIGILQEANKNIPTLLSSYRFLDFLLSKTTHAISREALVRIRRQCIMPRWREEVLAQATASGDHRPPTDERVYLAP